MFKSASLVLALVLAGTAVAAANDAVTNSNSTGVPSCTSIADNVSFCGSPAVWTVVPPASDAIPMQFKYDAAHYGEMIVEKLGLYSGLTLDSIQQAVILNAANYVGIDPKDVKIISVTDTQEFGATSRTIIYQISYKGQPVTYANTVVLQATEVVQLLTYALEDGYTDQQQMVHDAFLKATQIT